MTTPSWYVAPDQQREYVRELNKKDSWGFSAINFPRVPDSFTPRTPTEILMLNAFLPRHKDQPGLMRTMRALWPRIQKPAGHNKWCSQSILNEFGLKLRGDHQYTAGISWVAFDYNANRGLTPQEAVKQSTSNNDRLAGTEVLMAAVLFPDWLASLTGNSSPYLNLLGIELPHTTSMLMLFTEEAFSWMRPSELRLDVYVASGLQYRNGVSPTVREC